MAFSLGFVAADGIRGFEVEACVEQALQYTHPRLVFAVMEGEGQNAAGFQDAMSLSPAFGEYALIESVGVIWLACFIGDRFLSFRNVLRAEMLRVVFFQSESQPNVEVIRELSVMKQASERGIGNDQVAGR